MQIESSQIKMKKIVLGEMIRDHRRQNKLTQEQFGKLLGVSAQAISKWEREECYPDITLLPDIASLLLCSVCDFFASMV